MGVTAVITLFKSEGREPGFGKWGLLVSIPIILPILIALFYQVARPFLLEHF